MEKQEEDKEYYLYFIVTHLNEDKTIELKVNDKIKYKYGETLKKIHNENFKNSKDNEYVINIYRIRIDPNYFIINNKKSIKLPIEFQEYDGYIKTEQIIEEGKNCFLFDYTPIIKKKDIILDYLSMPHTLMFDFYVKILKDECKKITDEEFKDLIYYIKKNPINKKYKEYLYYYTDIFLEYYEIKEFSKDFIISFDISRIDFNNEYINDLKEKEIKHKINSIIGNNKIFGDFNNDQHCIYKIILLFMIFNLRFQKEIFYQMLGNKKMIEYIYKIINNNPTLFKISLNKENLNMLIKKTESYNEIINILSYNNNFLDLLEVIYNNKVLLSEIIIREKKFLNLGEYVNPKDSDDLNKIYGKILLLLNFEKKYDKYFIEFGDKLINNYINLFKDNFDNIILLYKIKKLIKEKNSFLSLENCYNNIQNIIKKKIKNK